jgi:hypothetical protein
MLPQNDSTVLASYLAEMLCGFSLAPLIRSFGVPRRFEAGADRSAGMLRSTPPANDFGPKAFQKFRLLKL